MSILKENTLNTQSVMLRKLISEMVEQKNEVCKIAEEITGGAIYCKTVSIRSSLGGYLTVQGGSCKSGTKLHIKEKDTSAAQVFTICSNGLIYSAVGSNMVIDVVAGGDSGLQMSPLEPQGYAQSEIQAKQWAAKQGIRWGGTGSSYCNKGLCVSSLPTAHSLRVPRVVPVITLEPPPPDYLCIRCLRSSHKPFTTHMIPVSYLVVSLLT